MKLQISDLQKTAVLDPVNPNLQDAFAEGVDAPSYPSTLAAMASYTTLSSPQQTSIKDVFRQVLAALVKALAIHGALPAQLTNGTAFSGTVALAKLTGGGANGSLTLVQGVVTAYTAPT